MMVTEEPEARAWMATRRSRKALVRDGLKTASGWGRRDWRASRGKPGRFGRGVVGENDAWSRFHVFRFGGEHLLAGQLLLLEPKRLPQFAPDAEELFAIRQLAPNEKEIDPPQVTVPKSPRQCGGN